VEKGENRGRKKRSSQTGGGKKKSGGMRGRVLENKKASIREKKSLGGAKKKGFGVIGVSPGVGFAHQAKGGNAEGKKNGPGDQPLAEIKATERGGEKKIKREVNRSRAELGSLRT